MENFHRSYKMVEVKEDERIKGDIILLSGFGKDGTYELSRMISKINKPHGRVYENKVNKNKEIWFNDEERFNDEEWFNDEKYVCTTEDLFRVINEAKKNDSYCIEIIFDFKQECRENNTENENCEKCYYGKEQKIILKSMVSIGVNSEGGIEEKDDLLKKLEKYPPPSSELPSPAVDPSASGVTSTA